MLHAPTSEKKTRTESSRTQQAEPEMELEQQVHPFGLGWPARQSLVGSGESADTSFDQHRAQLAKVQQTYGNQAVLRIMGRSPTVTASPLNQSGVLQRKCACGNSANSSGICAECQEKEEKSLGAGIQTKLTISQPGDKYEQEADRIADQVMRMPESSIQHQIDSEEQDEEERVQMKPITSQITPLIQRQMDEEEEEEEMLQTKITSGQTSTVSTSLQNRIAALQGGGQPLSHSEHAFFEPRFGADFSQVRIHADSQAAETASTVNARAFTLGRDIVFGAGQYQPQLSEGRRLLAHELTHVVQQSRMYDGGEHEFAKMLSQGAQNLLQRAVGYVGCRSATGRVREIVGDDPVGTIQEADTRAIEQLDRVIADLAYTRTQIQSGERTFWPVIQDSVALGLRNRFGLDPEDRETWTTNRRHTRGGDPSIKLLLIRLRAVRRTLARGHIRYECLTRPPCPPMSRTNNEVVLGGGDAFAEPATWTVFLCEQFWRPIGIEIPHVDYRAMILIHEAFHLYFEGIDRGRNMWNAHCINQFISDVYGIPIPTDYQGACG